MFWDIKIKHSKRGKVIVLTIQCLEYCFLTFYSRAKVSNEILSTHCKIMVNGECNKHKPLLAMIKLRVCTCM